MINLLFSAHGRTTNITDSSAFGRFPCSFKHFYNVVESHSFLAILQDPHARQGLPKAWLICFMHHAATNCYNYNCACTKLFARETWHSEKSLILCDQHCDSILFLIC